MKAERGRDPQAVTKQRRRQMRRDCARLMVSAIAATFLECLLSIASPTVLSILLGDMADALLALDAAGIWARMPAFLTAIFVTVLLTPGAALIKNLLLTRQGTAYDMFLMNSTLHMPYQSLHRVDAGDFLHRFESDRTMYYISLVRLLSYPFAIAVYVLFLAFLVIRSGYSALFCACIFLLSALSVVYDAAVAARQAELNRQTAEYEGKRTLLELELLSLKDFSRGFGLGRFLISRLRKLFEGYWEKSGKEQSRKTALGLVLQFLCDYGVQAASVLIGAVLVVQGQLTIGALLGGYLIIPTIRQGWIYIRQVVTDVQNEGKYGARMEYFYQDLEPEEGETLEEPAEQLVLHNVSFSYPGQSSPTLSHVNLTLTARENVQITGANGCGKSTLLSLLGGVYLPDEGRITDESGIALSPARLRRSTALLEQNSRVFTGTVWENLFLPQERVPEAQNLLVELGFTKPLEYPIQGDGKNLSPGERKKVLLARALLKQAPFVILDEPLNHLDAPARTALANCLQDRGRGVILVSHEALSQGHIPVRQILM